MIANVTLLTFVVLFLPFIAALCAPLAIGRLGHEGVWLLALAPALAFIHFLGFIPEIAAGEVVTGGYAWVPSFNLSFSWFIDGLSLTFALLITGIGTLIVLYAGGYMKGHQQQGRFMAFLLLFMGAMLGVVVSDSLMMLFVYWELTSITSFLLIGFDHRREAARRAALQALVVTGGEGWHFWRGSSSSGTSAAPRSCHFSFMAMTCCARARFISSPCFWCWAVPLPNQRSFRFTSGFRTPWRHRRRCRPICIPPPW